MPARDRVQHLRVAVAEDGATYSVAPPWFGSCDRDVRCSIRNALMLSRRPATWLRLLPLALVIPGCDGGQTSVSPTSVPAPASSISLTCVLGSTDCSAVMQGQTLTFTARPGDAPAAMRSAVLELRRRVAATRARRVHRAGHGVSRVHAPRVLHGAPRGDHGQRRDAGARRSRSRSTRWSPRRSPRPTSGT